MQEQGGVAERDGEAGSPLSREPNKKLDLRTLRSWPEAEGRYLNG